MKEYGNEQQQQQKKTSGFEKEPNSMIRNEN